MCQPSVNHVLQGVTISHRREIKGMRKKWLFFLKLQIIVTNAYQGRLVPLRIKVIRWNESSEFCFPSKPTLCLLRPFQKHDCICFRFCQHKTPPWQWACTYLFIIEKASLLQAKRTNNSDEYRKSSETFICYYICLCRVQHPQDCKS